MHIGSPRSIRNRPLADPPTSLQRSFTPKHYPSSVNSNTVPFAIKSFKRRHISPSTALIPDMEKTGVAGRVIASSARKRPWKHTSDRSPAQRQPVRTHKLQLLRPRNRPTLLFAEGTATGGSRRETRSASYRNCCHDAIRGVLCSDMAIASWKPVATKRRLVPLDTHNGRRTRRCPRGKTTDATKLGKPWCLTAKWWAWKAGRASSSR